MVNIFLVSPCPFFNPHCGVVGSLPISDGVPSSDIHHGIAWWSPQLGGSSTHWELCYLPRPVSALSGLFHIYTWLYIIYIYTPCIYIFAYIPSNYIYIRYIYIYICDFIYSHKYAIYLYIYMHKHMINIWYIYIYILDCLTIPFYASPRQLLNH